MLEDTTSYNYQGKVFYVKEYATSSKVSSPDAVYDEMKDIAKADQESLWIIGVNTKNLIISKDLVGLGGMSSAVVDPKILFRRLLLHSAASFILVHNHPSGDCTPSKEDKILTKRLQECGDMLDLKLLDHLIIGDDCSYSFKSEGVF